MNTTVDNTEYFKHFRAGDIIFKQGEAGNCAYIIEDGSVEICITMPDGSSQKLSERGAGSMIGEMALVDQSTRTATIIAKEDCKLLEITGEDFKNRLKGTDPIIQMAAQVILLRYRDTLGRVGVLSDSGVIPSVEDLERNTANTDDVIRSVKIANEFKKALENDELELYYQPINDIQDGQSMGFEALMRWNHPERGMVFPDEFIPVAEDSGLIVEASKWALKEACKTLKRIEAEMGMTGLLYMSVNFSGKDLGEDNFVHYVSDIISETDTDPEKIQIEITENMLIAQPEQAKKTLELCRDSGLKIAIDDFGTGYSSLSYLHHFPIDCLKIDRAFILNIQKNENSLRLVQSIIHLAKNLNMRVVAEGVETIEDLTILKNIGCDFAQGYYFSRPVPEKDVIEMLKNHNPGETEDIDDVDVFKLLEELKTANEQQ